MTFEMMPENEMVSPESESVSFEIGLRVAPVLSSESVRESEFATGATFVQVTVMLTVADPVDESDPSWAL